MKIFHEDNNLHTLQILGDREGVPFLHTVFQNSTVKSN